MKVRISRSLLSRILSLAEAERDEVCGLLLGTDRQIEAICPSANVALCPATHFEIDPAVLIGAHRQARSGGLAVIGHYHSHPSGQPQPSVTDAASAVADGSIWMIVAGRKVGVWRAEAGEGNCVRFAAITLDIM